MRLADRPITRPVARAATIGITIEGSRRSVEQFLRYADNRASPAGLTRFDLFVKRQQEDSVVKASVFIGTSLDGFIARANGDFDFLPPGGGEPHGYDEFMATVDALVIGRKTFETVLTLDAWPYGERPVFVLSTRLLAPAPVGAVVERMSGAPD
jgi:hypothetical protein